MKARIFKFLMVVYHFFRDAYIRLMWWPRHFVKSPLSKFKLNYYSMMGEDGIIEEIFYRLNIKGGWVVEFGAADGKLLSNTYRLFSENKNFHAVLIEAETKDIPDLKKVEAKFAPRVVAIQAMVMPEGESSLDSILGKTPIPKDFELLSVDVDSIDYQIWQGVKIYKPKVVVIEINSKIPALVPLVHGESEVIGTSFMSMLTLGIKKGYTCVCHNGNMFFVRDDLMPKIHLRKKYLKHPEKLFYSKWLGRKFNKSILFP